MVNKELTKPGKRQLYAGNGLIVKKVIFSPIKSGGKI